MGAETATVEARGDLDSDFVLSSYRMRCALLEMACDCTAIEIENELE